MSRSPYRTRTNNIFSAGSVPHIAATLGFSFLPSTLAQSTKPWKPNPITPAFSASSFPRTPATDSFASPYLSVIICCRKDIADALSEALLCFGACSTSIDEPERYEDHDELRMTSIFSVQQQDVHDCISRAADSICLKEIPSYEVAMLDDTNWIKETLESFHPVEVTKGLWIVPEWRTPPEPQATNIALDPGLAFGTGEHPTTKLCLLMLHSLIKGGELFLDYGTGSGILAIAALKFGAASSVGLDIDPQAITSAQRNAALNRIEPEKLKLQLVPSSCGSAFTDEMANEKCITHQNPYCTGVNLETNKFDVVIANILLNPLLDLASQIVSYAKPGAVVGISGVISEQVPCVVEHYSQFLEGITVSMMDDWACISGSKKKKN